MACEVALPAGLKSSEARERVLRLARQCMRAHMAPTERANANANRGLVLRSGGELWERKLNRVHVSRPGGLSLGQRSVGPGIRAGFRF